MDSFGSVALKLMRTIVEKVKGACIAFSLNVSNILKQNFVQELTEKKWVRETRYLYGKTYCKTNKLTKANVLHRPA